MKNQTARAVANVAVASAGAAAAYVVVTRPRLRRMAWRATRVWISAGVPAYLLTQVRNAWRESAVPTPVVQRPW